MKVWSEFNNILITNSNRYSIIVALVAYFNYDRNMDVATENSKD